MTFGTDAWQAIAPIRAAIDELPFLTQLRDGSLERESFTVYLAQDAHYLADYGRVLALAASQSTGSGELAFWAKSAQGVVVVERALHGTYLEDFSITPKSATCTAYTSFLFSLAAGGCYPALVAGILPCFWIYHDVGTRLVADAGDLDSHPYGDWIGTYADPDFAASTRQARDIVDRLAAHASAEVVARMQDAFVTAARYEWMFWDAAMRPVGWPI